MRNPVLKRIVKFWLAGLIILQPDLAHARPVWTDVYSASPANYSLPADIPSQMKAMLEPKLAEGTVRTSFVIVEGGSQLRIRISNEEGAEPLEIAAASVAIADPGTGEPSGPLRPLHFSGGAAVTIPPGTPMLSDPVDLMTKPFQRLIVNVYLPKGAKFVGLGGGNFALAPGDQTTAQSLTSASHLSGRPLISGAAVETNQSIPLVVTMGDSITDGVRASPGALAGYPEVLAHRLEALPEAQKRIVLNAGIAGNRLLSGGWGRSALARLDRDVLRFANVRYLLLLEGINDIGLGGAPLTQLEPVATADQIIVAYRQIIARAHARGIKVIGATLTPFEGAFYYTPQKDAVRTSVNEWVRTAGAFDDVVDFDLLVRDPGHPGKLRPEFDSGDHLHPSDKGYRAMGEGIDLRVFR